MSIMTADDQASQTVTDKELRTFGLMMGGMFILMFGLFIPWIWSFEKTPSWPFIVAVVFAVPALVYPKALSPIYAVWMKIALALGWFNTRLILGIVFFLFFFPFGMIMRLFGKDPMARKYDKSTNSYRIESKKTRVESLRNPY